MGSGKGGGYGSGSSGSQPYAPTYYVTSDMIERDKADPDIYSLSTGYFKNPTATNLEVAITGNRVIFNGKSANGTMTYVMDTEGNIIFGKRSNPNNAAKRAPHPTLLGGKDPLVQCAGMITFYKGRIQSINNSSGHYRPNSKSLDKVETALHRLYEKNASLFDKKWKWSE